MTQPHPLGDMPRAGAPDEGVLEGLLERPVNAIAHVLDGAITPHNQSLAKVRVGALALGVDADELELLPAAVDDVLDAEVELAGHDAGVGLAREFVEEVQGHTVDLVVHVQALDVLAVVLHNHVDEVVDRHVLVAHQDFAVEDLVVAQNVHHHLLVEAVLGRCLEGDLHAAGLFGFEVDVSEEKDVSLAGPGKEGRRRQQ